LDDIWSSFDSLGWGTSTAGQASNWGMSAGPEQGIRIETSRERRERLRAEAEQKQSTDAEDASPAMAGIREVDESQSLERSMGAHGRDKEKEARVREEMRAAQARKDAMEEGMEEEINMGSDDDGSDGLPGLW